ncbi:Mitochondrial genome maintenance protein [Colletotrichum tanaceti]|uniref:Mitochondrial genome maintenance protein MGM101 n=1 Tax=Colletotrichum tanaceti TaxID=1306861 RepID=A0A4U6X020_9PEZI|nr:Mitochondrial genome maintenance protein [Colletotrichum tanaceti]TKW48344.1 Mitochondrial genome maintenance protein [Colletotrichum tanaceti]
MASSFGPLRPLFRATSRQSLAQTARITTTSRSNAAAAAAATTTAQRVTPAKSTTTYNSARRFPASNTSRAAEPKPATTAPATAPLDHASDATPLPQAPSTSSPRKTTSFSASAGPPYQPQQQQQQQQQQLGHVIDWSTSYYGLGSQRFSKEIVDILLQPVNVDDVEVKPDGVIYLPEIKYRRILNAAFGPGGWGLAPKGEVVVGEKIVTREYALIAEGRYVVF